MLFSFTRRCTGLVLTLLVASFLIYSALVVAPGDPAQLLAGRNPTPETLALIREKYHLDDPFLVQYWHWLSAVMTGDLGYSPTFRADVTTLISQRYLSTVLLVAYASTLIGVFGIGGGVAAALMGKGARSTLAGLSAAAMGTPTFAIALVLITTFARNLDWFPIYGSGSGLLDRLWHLTLPAFALALAFGGYVARVTSTAVSAELGSEHVAVARIRGVPERIIVRKHVLNNALPPILTIAGLTIAGLLAGSAVAEQAFGVNGLGSLLVISAQRQDMSVLLVTSLIVVTAFVTINGAVDAVVQVIDPRARARRTK
ncbi:ABC transporter permease [Streptomyces thinghirensis]|uniref:ABC transporter permease n=1 Tax=Streptomyces thinghirensis TaxID=551547 RepID=A0ABP9T8D7_9ACTN